MKPLNHFLKPALFLFLFLFLAPQANAQFLKKLGKRAEKAAERVVEKRVEKESEEKTDQVLDSILEPKKKQKRSAPKKEKGNTKPSDSSTSSESNSVEKNTSKSIEIYSKFDFVPGDKTLFFDDFKNDFIGDFPSKWNTNSSGELVQIDDSPNKWLKIFPGHQSRYIPDITNLPEEFTLEFDVMTNGLNNKTSSQSYLAVIIGDNNSFNKPVNFGMVEYSFCQFIDPGTVIENNKNGKREIRSIVNVDLRKVVLEKHHISVAVNKQRLRMWINELKIVDVPRLLPSNITMNGIKLGVRGIDINTEAIFLSNFKIAQGGIDLRRKLISEGKISTNGILFDSGSATIQPQSMGIIRQIYQVLQQESSLKLKIVGHTDADGNDATNLMLSKKRAQAIKNVLTNVYKISSDRLQTEGKGETKPVGDNTTPEGKAQNRRVEFIKQ